MVQGGKKSDSKENKLRDGYCGHVELENRKQLFLEEN